MDNYTRLLIRAVKQIHENGYAAFETLRRLKDMNDNFWRDLYAIEERYSYAN